MKRATSTGKMPTDTTELGSKKRKMVHGDMVVVEKRSRKKG